MKESQNKIDRRTVSVATHFVPRADIAIVISGLQRGGAERVASSLANMWSRAGQRVTLITFLPADDDAFSLEGGVERTVAAIPGWPGILRNRISGNLLRIVALRSQIRQSGAPVVVSFIAATNILAIMATAGLRLRLVVSERNDPAHQRLDRPWGALRRYLYRYADRVTANSHGALRTMSAYVPEDRLTHVANPLAIPRRIEPAPIAKPCILAVGRLHFQKGYDVLIKAYAACSARRLGWRLVILGSGPLEATLKELARQQGIADDIDWLGSVDDPFPYYRAADLFVLPSRYEGMPNALLEAMGTGLPCIVSDSSEGPLELVEDGVTGRVVPVEDPDALARTIDQLADDPSQAAQLASAGQARVQQSFSPDSVLQSWSRATGLAQSTATIADSDAN